LKLEAGRNDLGGPGDARGVVVGLEHEVEVARVGRIDGEVVRAVPRVGLGVGGEPCLCEMIVSVCSSNVIPCSEKLTERLLGEVLVLLVTAHLIDLLRHGLDVQDDQFVEIAVAELAHTQGTADAVLVLLVEFQDVDVLVDVVVNLPSDSKMVRALGGRTDDAVATLDVRLRKFGLGLV